MIDNFKDRYIQLVDENLTLKRDLEKAKKIFNGLEQVIIMLETKADKYQCQFNIAMDEIAKLKSIVEGDENLTKKAGEFDSAFIKFMIPLDLMEHYADIFANENDANIILGEMINFTGEIISGHLTEYYHGDNSDVEKTH